MGIPIPGKRDFYIETGPRIFFLLIFDIDETIKFFMQLLFVLAIYIAKMWIIQSHISHHGHLCKYFHEDFILSFNYLMPKQIDFDLSNHFENWCTLMNWKLMYLDEQNHRHTDMISMG